MGSYMKTTAALEAAEKGKGEEKMTTVTTKTRAAPSASSISSSNPTRAVKQFLYEVVRDDWQFAPPPPSTVEGTKPKKNDKDHATQREVVAWRCREEGLSDIENDRDASGRRRASRASIRAGSALYDYQNVNQENNAVVDDCSANPYKFDTPDAVGDFVRERRRKRRRLIAEECIWNDGLRNWIRQRDAWTGAVERKPLSQQAGGEVKAQQQQKGKSRTWHARNESGGTMDSVLPFSSGSEVSHEPPAHDASSSPTSADDISQNLLATAAAAGKEGEKKKEEKDAAAAEYGDDDDDDDDDDNLLGPYLPIYPPFFDEDHVLRSRIQPLAYSVIYSKVVIQSLTPNIPIPLTHMTKILVEGWKAEGNWPPEGTQPTVTAGAAATNKFGRSARFLKWKRERAAARDARNAALAAAAAATATATSTAGAAGAAVADDGKEGAAGGGGKRERVRKSIINFAVKKGLGLGGHHSQSQSHSTSTKAGPVAAAVAAAAEADKVESSVFGRKSKDGAAEDMDDVGIEFREHSGNEEDGEQETPEDEREASRVY